MYIYLSRNFSWYLLFIIIFFSKFCCSCMHLDFFTFECIWIWIILLHSRLGARKCVHFHCCDVFVNQILLLEEESLRKEGEEESLLMSVEWSFLHVAVERSFLQLLRGTKLHSTLISKDASPPSLAQCFLSLPLPCTGHFLSQHQIWPINTLEHRKWTHFLSPNLLWTRIIQIWMQQNLDTCKNKRIWEKDYDKQKVSRKIPTERDKYTLGLKVIRMNRHQIIATTTIVAHDEPKRSIIPNTTHLIKL